MPDVVLTRQRVEPGKVERLREWTDELQQRADEALATLADEGVLTESAFLEERDDGTFLVYYLEAEDLERAMETFEESDHAIDADHAAVMEEVLVDGQDVGEFELLYHLAGPDR